jgi:uncharacterized protein (DUF1330 family)
MPKGYMLSAHRRPADPEKRDAYAKLAGPALEAAGGKLIAAGGRVEARENGLAERTVLIEFESDLYQEALRALDGGADRDIRLFEGL